MYIDADVIIKLASLLAALSAIGVAAYKVIKWVQSQEQQTKDIEETRQKQQREMEQVQEELCLLTYGLLACLKGLKEQGCNGPVTEAIDKLERHMNKKAHGQ